MYYGLNLNWIHSFIVSWNFFSYQVELSLATSRNKSGTKYRVTDNLEQVFAKFVSQGKMTVRFKQPQHDLCFTGEARHLEKVTLSGILKNLLSYC